LVTKLNQMEQIDSSSRSDKSTGSSSDPNENKHDSKNRRKDLDPNWKIPKDRLALLKYEIFHKM